MLEINRNLQGKLFFTGYNMCLPCLKPYLVKVKKALAQEVIHTLRKNLAFLQMHSCLTTKHWVNYYALINLHTCSLFLPCSTPVTCKCFAYASKTIA